MKFNISLRIEKKKKVHQGKKTVKGEMLNQNYVIGLGLYHQLCCITVTVQTLTKTVQLSFFLRKTKLEKVIIVFDHLMSFKMIGL